MNINRVTIAGRIGQKPELKICENGAAVCKLSVATNEYWKDKEGKKQQRTSWHAISTWGRQAEWVSENINKGDPVFIEGKIQYSEWFDSEQNKRQGLEIVARTIETFAPNKKNDELRITTEEIPF